MSYARPPERARLPLLQRLLACVAALLLAGAAHAQATYAPDSSAAVAAAYPWIDIAALGDTKSLNDEAVSVAIDIGFAFTFGTQAYDKVKIASNGQLQFDAASAGGTNSALPLTGAGGEPNIDAVMAPLWDDLNPDNDGRYIRHVTLGRAPNRVFVVSWIALPYWCRNDSPSDCNPAKSTTKNASATFQVQLHEAGHFVYRYQAVNGAGGTHTGGATFRNPQGASIGYELGDGDFVQYALRTASVPAGTTILWQRRLNLPGRFNAFDPGTPAGAIVGVVTTKVAGAPFDLAVVALDVSRTRVLTSFTGTVKVELLDARDNTGALDAATGCRASWVAMAGAPVRTLDFASADQGRKVIGLTEADAWRDGRVRISHPATGTATVMGCSTDNFAIRPAGFDQAAARDADAQAAGTARALSNTAASGGVVHKAGRPFTVSARAVNAAGAVTARYDGTPLALLTPCAGTACAGTPGSLSLTTAAVAGLIVDDAATYSETGAFDLQLADDRFASVDAGDGSSAAERTVVSPKFGVGRFVPDHFVLEPLVAPLLRTFGSAGCAARSFTYIGQPFGWATAPQAIVSATAADGSVTSNYAGALWKLTGAATPPLAQAWAASPALAATTAAPSITGNGDGTGVIAASAADSLAFVRAGAPMAPFTADIALTWRVTDASESAVPGNGTIGTPAPLLFGSIPFDAGAAFRYGMLKLASAYGSELNALPVPVQALWWNGQSFVANAEDHCTGVPSAAVALANWQRNLAACDTSPAPGTLRLAAGRGFLTLRRPGAGHHGSADLTLQLGASAGTAQTCAASPGAPSAAAAAALGWLQGPWGGAAGYAANPTARASFGQYRSPVMHLREIY